MKTARRRDNVFLYGNGGSLIAEADGNGRIVSEHIWLNGQLLASFKSGTVTEAGIDIAPDTLNLASKGVMTCFVKIPEGYDAADVMQDSIVLNETVCASKVVVGDYDNDGIPDLTVKFDREQVCAFLEPGEAVEIMVSGTVGDVRFSGTDTIRVIGKYKPGKKPGIPICEPIGNTDRVCFYHLNHLGTPYAITDQDGNILWQADYKPFGEAVVATGDVRNSFRFPGQYFDAETGLHYNWHRYYDPATGRYLTADPIGLEGGINLYSYALNDPVSFVDPDGQFAWLAALMVVYEVLDLASSVYEAYTVAETIADPDASLSEKGITSGFFIMGMVTPLPGGVSTACKKAPKLKRLHQSSLKESTLNYLRDKSTEEIVESLKQEGFQKLTVRPDGTVLQGNYRLKILEERGFDTSELFEDATIVSKEPLAPWE